MNAAEWTRTATASNDRPATPTTGRWRQPHKTQGAYPLAVVPDAQEYSFDVQLQQLMDRKRKLAQDLLAPPAFTAEDYKALVAGTLRSKA